MQITKNFSTDEFTRSQTAIRRGLDNSLPDKYLPNLHKLVIEILQPLRDHLKKEIIISSGYRNKVINSLVGGSPNSAHLEALAADIIVKNTLTTSLMKSIISLDLPFDMIINEFDSWVHVQAAPEGKEPRKRIMKAYRVGGITKYREMKL